MMLTRSRKQELLTALEEFRYAIGRDPATIELAEIVSALIEAIPETREEGLSLAERAEQQNGGPLKPPAPFPASARYSTSQLASEAWREAVEVLRDPEATMTARLSVARRIEALTASQESGE
jgi:hypothetical protein